MSIVQGPREGDHHQLPRQDLEGETNPDVMCRPIHTPRLALVLLRHSWLVAFVQKTSLPALGFTDPHNVFAEDEYVLDLRRNQVEEDRASEPWLLRAVVLRSTGEAVGSIGFHGPPDARGMVEIGYSIHPHFRRRGLASESAEGMWRWAAAAEARVLRATVNPANQPSLSLLRRAGFVHVGEQYDQRDGLELIFERLA